MEIMAIIMGVVVMVIIAQYEWFNIEKICQINFACFIGDCECTYLAVISKILVIMNLSIGDIPWITTGVKFRSPGENKQQYC